MENIKFYVQAYEVGQRGNLRHDGCISGEDRAHISGMIDELVLLKYNTRDGIL